MIGISGWGEDFSHLNRNPLKQTTKKQRTSFWKILWETYSDPARAQTWTQKRIYIMERSEKSCAPEVSVPAA